MPYDPLTFGLAMLGYALLALDASARARRRRAAALTRVCLVVIVAHVACVWTFRFGWSLNAMWQKSAPGFLLFHGALFLLLSSLLARGKLQDRLLWSGFVIVSAGAVPAPFRYPEIGALRLPMVVTFAAAAWVMLSAVLRATRAQPPSDARS